jgi:hypothetical protein
LTQLSEVLLVHLVSSSPEIWQPLLEVNHLLHTVALECFRLADVAIIEAAPSLLPGIKAKDLTKNNALGFFQRLLNRLHDNAELLGCDRKSEGVLTGHERMIWECGQYRTLLSEVQASTQTAKRDDFEKFVHLVAERLQIDISAYSDLRQCWNEAVKEHSELSGITGLTLFNQGFRFVPPEIGTLTGLENLYLGSNQLRMLPPEMSHLTKLKRVDLSSNQFCDGEGLSLPGSLEHLNLSENRLSKIPDELSQLSLKHLEISNNPLAEVPGVIPSLQGLERLFMNGIGLKAMLTGLPDTLRELYLSNNQIEEVSIEEISSLAKLQKVFLYGNPLSAKTLRTLEKSDSSLRPKELKWNQPVSPPRFDE